MNLRTALPVHGRLVREASEALRRRSHETRTRQLSVALSAALDRTRQIAA
ncbi:hypothetical protein ACIO6T_39185 [Streptomyces sp. NPDC087532]